MYIVTRVTEIDKWTYKTDNLFRLHLSVAIVFEGIVVSHKDT